MNRMVPWIVVAVFAIYLGAEMVTPGRSSEGFDVAGFGRLPVMLNGRVQPIDSVARLGLLQIHGAVNPPVENAKFWKFRTRRFGPTEWLLELMAKPDTADRRRIFHIRDATLLKTLDLKPTSASGPSDYTFSELAVKLPEIGKQAARISQLKANQQAPWERELMSLRASIATYERFKNSIQPNSLMQQQRVKGIQVDYDFATQVGKYHEDLQVGVKAAIARVHGGDELLDKATENRMRSFARPFVGVSNAALFAVIPPSDPQSSRASWRNMGTVIVDSARTGELPEPVGHFAVMSSAYAHGKTAIFNEQVARYQQWLRMHGLYPDVSRARSEFFFNSFEPFVRAAAIYLVTFVLVLVSWWKRSTAMYRSAAALAVVAWGLHTTGLLVDMMLEGRPPIANWYSTILFAGWAVFLVAALAERFRSNGIGLTAAALAGLGAIAVAHNLAPGGGVALIRHVVDVSFVIAVVTTVGALRLGRSTLTARRLAVAAA